MSRINIACSEEKLISGSLWKLNTNVNGFKNIKSNELATEVISGRKFEIKHNIQRTYNGTRLRVRLLEDSYDCWFELKDIIDHIEPINRWRPTTLSKEQIKKKLPNILNWIEKSYNIPNHYLWGGTVGPNFDCSGLIQRAFSIEGIWLPRDAYQQERFCTSLKFDQNTLKEIHPGDLLFFGTKYKCSHVAIYKGGSSYWHSSGKQHGHNGIGIDTLQPITKNTISSYYLSIFRGAGRVESCHDGSSLT
ncbi:C40 family peptidase [Prochlorococcus marinus]|uniref:C40 family peptidase n=1 Tax=Prochlorococcus marinus TaxID=1219 RepID=UPI0022B5B835|nr:C40 family peptidase [Prochlorococcus marinus]